MPSNHRTILLVSRTGFLPSLVLLTLGLAHASGEDLRIETAVLSVIDESHVAAVEAGTVMEMAVDVGQCVSAGTLLARLDDRDAQLERERTRIEYERAEQAVNDVDLRSANEALTLAELDLRRAREAVDRYAKSVSAAQIDRLEVIAARAKLDVERAEQDMQAARLAVDAAKNAMVIAERGIERRQIVAPINGTVVTVDVRRGEWVDLGKPVCRIVNIDRLRGGICRIPSTGRRPAIAEVTFATNQVKEPQSGFRGVVTFVSPEVNRVNGQVRVWAEIDNAEQSLRPGITGSLRVHEPPIAEDRSVHSTRHMLRHRVDSRGMSNHAPTLAATIDRPLPLRRAPDLRFKLQTLRGVSGWVVHDPVALRNYQLGPHEQFLLDRLDGQVSLSQLKQLFEQQFAPHKLDLNHLHAFLRTMHREGLLLAETEGQGSQLLVRRQELLMKKRWTRAANLLAIRLPGVNPSRLLRRIEPYLRWCFSPFFLAFAFSLVVVATWIVSRAAIRGELPGWQDMMNWRSGLYIFCAIGLAKVLHELGHALTCRHFGGRCHEMGLMLLVFAPCLYCDVSSSVMSLSKWQRIAVSSAGIVVELLIAAAAIVLWQVAQPGPLRDFCFLLAVVCSVNTLLINGNPLLRFDGYYILADYLEIPNLQSSSSQCFRDLWSRLFVDPELAQRLPSHIAPTGVLFGYGVLSFVYRLAIVVGIVSMGYAVLQRFGAEPLAHLLAAGVLVNVIVLPQLPWLRAIADPVTRRHVRWPRVATASGLSTALLLLLGTIPWPQRLYLDTVLQPRDAERVYVTVPGILNRCVSEGQQVQVGQPIASLTNLELDFEIAKLQSELNEQRQHVEDLKRIQGAEPGAAEQLPTAVASMEELQDRLHQRTTDRDRLILRASRSGTVLPAQCRGGHDVR